MGKEPLAEPLACGQHYALRRDLTQGQALPCLEFSPAATAAAAYPHRLGSRDAVAVRNRRQSSKARRGLMTTGIHQSAGLVHCRPVSGWGPSHRNPEGPSSFMQRKQGLQFHAAQAYSAAAITRPRLCPRAPARNPAAPLSARHPAPYSRLHTARSDPPPQP